jgi:SAM-dependent methyltransferase
VTGLDFSAPAISAARKLASDAGIEAEFVAADVYGAVEALDGRRFDLVYTGVGALNWLPEIERWARVMAALVAPGGHFYLAEFIPSSQFSATTTSPSCIRTSTPSPWCGTSPAVTPILTPRRCTTAALSGTTASARWSRGW